MSLHSILYKKLLSITKRIFTYETLILMENDKYTEISSPASIKIANNDNVLDILYFQHQKYVSKFLEFLDNGDYGYLGYLDDKCIHRSWIKSNQQKVSLHWAIPYQLKSNEHFIHYCETAPEARGKNIYPAVLSKIVRDFKEKGKILISVNTKNLPSKKGIRKAGFRERGRQTVLVVLGIKIRIKNSIE